MVKRICIIAGVALTSVSSGMTQWNNDLNENTIVSPFTGQPTLVTDGENGVIVFSQSRDVNPVLRAQRIDVRGELRWPGLQGVLVSSAGDAQWIREPIRSERFALPDGEGGAYLAYHVGRIIGQEPEVGDIHAISGFVQRLNGSGDRLFGDDGLRLVPILPDTFQFEQRIMNMIPDGTGGVFVLLSLVSRDSTQYNGVYLNRVRPDGVPLWEVQKLTQRSDTYLPYLDHELNLNLYEYPGETNPPGGKPDRFLKIDASTGESITERSIEIGTGEYGFNAFYDFDQSCNGSALFAFNDFRADTLRVQKLDGDGNTLWGEEPMVIANTLFTRGKFEIISDRHGGSYLWYMTPDTVLHLLLLDGSGNLDWREEFITHRASAPSILLPSRTSKNPTAVAPDGDVFVLTDGFQVVTKISKAGEVLWESRISNRVGIAANIDSYEALADADGGCTVAWEEVGSFVGIRAQRVDRSGNLGGTTPVEDDARRNLPESFVLEPPHPNPFTDMVKIVFSNPESQSVSLKVYNILGREVITLKQDRLFGGRHAVLWDGTDQLGRKLSSGIYLLVLRSGQASVNRKLLLLK